MMSHTIYMYICIYIMYHAYDYDAPNLTDLSPRQHEIWDNCKSPRTTEVENEDCFYSSTIKWLMEKHPYTLEGEPLLAQTLLFSEVTTSHGSIVPKTHHCMSRQHWTSASDFDNSPNKRQLYCFLVPNRLLVSFMLKSRRYWHI